MSAAPSIRRLSEFFPLAPLSRADFSTRVNYPVLIVGRGRKEGQEIATGTVTLAPKSDPGVEDVVIALEPKPGAAFLMIGRGSSADVLLPFDTISRSHARLRRDEAGRLFIADQGSKNGSWLNGQPLEPNQPYAVRDGDRLRFGDVEGILLLPPSFHELLREEA